MYGTLKEYTALDDAWVMGLVLGSFLILMLVVGHQREYIGKLSRRFFLPTNKEEKPGQLTPGERTLPYLSSLSLVGSSGVMLFAYVNRMYDLEQSPFYIWSVLLLCVGGLAGYYLVRYLLYVFVNWVFFDRHQRKAWLSVFGLLMVYESVLSYVLMCCAMFYRLSLYETGLALIICYGLVRLLVILCTKRLFFPNFYGLLHLFAYLCTLEMLPLLALWKFCDFWGTQLIIK